MGGFCGWHLVIHTSGVSSGGSSSSRIVRSLDLGKDLVLFHADCTTDSGYSLSL